MEIIVEEEDAEEEEAAAIVHRKAPKSLPTVVERSTQNHCP